MGMLPNCSTSHSISKTVIVSWFRQFLAVRVHLDPPLNHKGPPYEKKTRKNCAIEKYQNITVFGQNCKKGQFFKVFLDFFQNGTLQRPEVFCVAFSASGHFF